LAFRHCTARLAAWTADAARDILLGTRFQATLAVSLTASSAHAHSSGGRVSAMVLPALGDTVEDGRRDDAEGKRAAKTT